MDGDFIIGGNIFEFSEKRMTIFASFHLVVSAKSQKYVYR